MTESPPALTQLPQFSPEYWQKVRRNTTQAVIERVTYHTVDDVEYTEIVLQGGIAFRRKRSEIEQLLTANMQVHIESIGHGEGTLVTGLFVPSVRGWAFRMTAEDLAEYTKALTVHLHNKRQEARGRMVLHVADHLEMALDELRITFDNEEAKTEAAQLLAVVAIGSLEQGPQE